jgi:hypothetical protein
VLGYVLRVISTFGRLDFSTVKPVMSEPYRPAGLRIQQITPAHIETQSRNITCNIDSTACLAEEGHKTTRQLTDEYGEQGVEAVNEYAHKEASLGQWLVHAQKGENVYKEAAESELKGDIPDTGIRFVPSVRPQITWNMNALRITGVPEKDNYRWSTTTWAPASLEREASLTVTEPVKPEIHMDVTGNFNTLRLFQSVDQRA